MGLSISAVTKMYTNESNEKDNFWLKTIGKYILKLYIVYYIFLNVILNCHLCEILKPLTILKWHFMVSG